MPNASAGNVDLKNPLITTSWDKDAFDVFERSQGAQMVHWRGMECPVGLQDRFDVRQIHPHHKNCSNGHLYTCAGLVTCLFMGNSSKKDQHDTGLMSQATANVTAPTTYDDCPDKIVDVLPFDRFFLKEEAVTVPHTQLVEAHTTGHDRLDYPVVSVVDIVDSKGEVHGPEEYKIEDGQVVWTKGGLGFDLTNNKGMIYAIRYNYRPFWYVVRLNQQLRLAQVETEAGRVLKRFSQEFVLQREYIFEKAQKDFLAPVDGETDRQTKGPRQTAFGPR
jgi:hypothetical protein